MFTSFSTALSALNAHTTAIDAVGNNLANLNTTGFKSSVAAFHDLVTQSMGAGPAGGQAGFGVARPSILRQFSQGVVQSSSGPLDAAIQGDGFLVVKNDAGATLYTRGGHLLVDKNGALQTSTGEYVQGWMESGGVLNATGAIGNIVVPVGTLKPPTATTGFSFDLNLDATAAVATTPPSGTTPPFTPPYSSPTFSNSVEVFDSLGVSHLVNIDFYYSAAAAPAATPPTPATWDYVISVPGETVTGAAATGQLTFDSAGKLIAPAAWPAATVTIATPSTGAAPINLYWDLFNGVSPRLTQYAQPSAVSARAQDGSPAAQLMSVGILDGGRVFAQYSDGEQKIVAQLAMAGIRNPQSLIAAGNNNYQLGADTALPAIGLPGTGGRGNVIGSAVENSTVDIAKEFTHLIVFQRAFQANTRVVSALDELSQETINLKR
ncbi:MAG: flagellar hook protein FlgE [Bryobacteraceae bacterium]|nr:flagellar hook protein FlgE [Bryobacteraceae bacterium]